LLVLGKPLLRWNPLFPAADGCKAELMFVETKNLALIDQTGIKTQAHFWFPQLVWPLLLPLGVRVRCRMNTVTFALHEEA
jgi:hypothetical protein